MSNSPFFFFLLFSFFSLRFVSFSLLLSIKGSCSAALNALGNSSDPDAVTVSAALTSLSGQEARDAFVALGSADRAAVVNFLGSLVLFSMEEEGTLYSLTKYVLITNAKHTPTTNVMKNAKPG